MSRVAKTCLRALRTVCRTGSGTRLAAPPSSADAPDGSYGSALMGPAQRRTSRRSEGNSSASPARRRKWPVITGASVTVFILIAWRILSPRLQQDTGLGSREVAVLVCLVLAAFLVVSAAVAKIRKWDRRSKGTTHSADDVLNDDSIPSTAGCNSSARLGPGAGSSRQGCRRSHTCARSRVIGVVSRGRSIGIPRSHLVQRCE